MDLSNYLTEDNNSSYKECLKDKMGCKHDINVFMPVKNRYSFDISKHTIYLKFHSFILLLRELEVVCVSNLENGCEHTNFPCHIHSFLLRELEVV